MIALLQTKKRRYSGNDTHFGPLTLSRHSSGSWRPLGMILDSGDGDESPGCNFRLQGFGWTLICELPAIIKPWAKWVDTSHYDWATSPTAGYWDRHKQEFGFCSNEGHVSLYYGPQTGDSVTTKRRGYFLPWQQWRHVRFSLYDASGALFWEQRQRKDIRGAAAFVDQWDAEKACPSLTFALRDYDGAEITATTQIHEREWRFGDGWFKWLGLFRAPMIKRSLNISFSSETGPEKGSWKGGTCGTSIEMLPNEFHESACRRYCQQEHSSKYSKYKVEFIGRLTIGT